jgi:hexosaminidase
MGWDEIIYGGISKDATMMLWRNWAPFYEPAITGAIKNGNNIVVTTLGPYYFDYGDGAKYANFDADGNEKGKGVYSKNFIPSEYLGTAHESKFVGVQGCLWAEYLPNYKRLQFMAFPRLLALAESAWTPQADKDVKDFEARLENHYPRLEAKGATYALPKVSGVSKNVVVTQDKPATISLKSRFKGAKIYYTLDGSKPTANSMLYTKPFSISKKTTIKIASFYNNMRSDVQVIEADTQEYLESEEVQGETLSLGIRRSHIIKKATHKGEIVIQKEPGHAVVKTIGLNELKDDAFVYEMTFNGYFLAPETGIYDMRLGARGKGTLEVSGRKVNSRKNGLVALKKGYHPIKVTYKTGHRNGLTFSVTHNGNAVNLNESLYYK